MKKWLLRRNKADIEKMAACLGISPVTAHIMANRGIGTYEAAMRFMECRLEDMYDGNMFKDMKKAVDIVSNAIDNGQNIVIYGDYDVDGVMSTVILYKTIKHFGKNVAYYVPHRQKEGYGLNMSAVEELKNAGADIIFACDNGIAAIDEAQAIADSKMELIILDHHEPPVDIDGGSQKEVVPKAAAVVDHKQKKCPYPFKALCAGAMAYKFSKLLFEKILFKRRPSDFICNCLSETICYYLLII